MQLKCLVKMSMKSEAPATLSRLIAPQHSNWYIDYDIFIYIISFEYDYVEI